MSISRNSARSEDIGADELIVGVRVAICQERSAKDDEITGGSSPERSPGAHEHEITERNDDDDESIEGYERERDGSL